MSIMRRYVMICRILIFTINFKFSEIINFSGLTKLRLNVNLTYFQKKRT